MAGMFERAGGEPLFFSLDLDLKFLKTKINCSFFFLFFFLITRAAAPYPFLNKRTVAQ